MPGTKHNRRNDKRVLSLWQQAAIRQTERKTGRQTERQTDRERGTDREADRQIVEPSARRQETGEKHEDVRRRRPCPKMGSQKGAMLPLQLSAPDSSCCLLHQAITKCLVASSSSARLSRLRGVCAAWDCESLTQDCSGFAFSHPRHLPIMLLFLWTVRVTHVPQIWRIWRVSVLLPHPLLASVGPA